MVVVRPAELSDLNALVALEASCFATDRLSRRSFRHWITSERSLLLVASLESRVVGYVLLLLKQGIGMARLYSIAVDPAYRRQGIARQLLLEGERQAKADGKLYVRLEVNRDDEAALAFLYSSGYKQPGMYRDKSAVRMQKRIRRYTDIARHRSVPWIRQTTSFTCGPASLMMAMSALDSNYKPSRHEELQLWRESTTIFMTSGHGGCHPLGLALSAMQRGFSVDVWINQQGPLFVDSVRDSAKKQVIELVHNDFLEQVLASSVNLYYADIYQDELTRAFAEGGIPVILISTYRMDGKKAPHWVTLSGYDIECLYVHDPDTDEPEQSEMNNQFLPVSRLDFDRMSAFGSSRLRTALIIRK